MFSRLWKSRALKAHVSKKAAEARRLYAELAEGKERLPNGLVRSASSRDDQRAHSEGWRPPIPTHRGQSIEEMIVIAG